MREVTCPGCGEVLGVPKELEGGKIRCGVCERVIDTGASNSGSRPRRSEERDDDRNDRRSDERPSRRNFDDRDEDAPRSRRRGRDDDDDHDRPKKKSGCGVWVWILLVLGILGLGCCGCGGFFLYQASDPTWEKFSPPDAKWSAEFPGKPKLETKPIAGAQGGNTTQYAGLRKFGQEGYIVGYFDVNANDLKFTTTDKVLNDSLDGILKGEMNPKEVSRKDLKMAGVDAKELTLDVTDAKAGSGRMIVRVLIADNRVYMLIAVKAGKDRQPPEQAERFFNSFNLNSKK